MSRYMSWRLSIDAEQLERMAGALRKECNETTSPVEQAYWLGASEVLYALLERKDVPDEGSIAACIRGVLYSIHDQEE